MLNAKIVTANLFSNFFPADKVNWREVQSKYVSEVVNKHEFFEWDRTYGTHQVPVLISAPTGSGKNYMVTHDLREYAKKLSRHILYISNRIALDNQQKKDLAKLTRVDYDRSPTYFVECDYEAVFDNVTVITYNRLLHKFYNLNENAAWFNAFDYVVIDECHFFYSDSYFNAYTDIILQNITERFSRAIRIYMSATFEDVIQPIFWYEWRSQMTDENRLDYLEYFCRKNPFAYMFPRDFSHYRVKFFDTLEEDIIPMTCSNLNPEYKSLIFITDKDEGKQLCQCLQETFKKLKEDKLKSVFGDKYNNMREVIIEETDLDDKARSMFAYLDSDSRHNPSSESKKTWDAILETGKLPCKVLFTTSVLDNGFSIKDDKVENIIICTDDKTEFLQELGRRRIMKDGEIINLYIRNG